MHLHPASPSVALSPAWKDDGKEHCPDESPTRQGNTAGCSGKRVVVERTGVEVLDVEANFF